MQNILIVAHESPYGSEKLFNALRIAIALKEQETEVIQLKIFLMSDAVYGAVKNQVTPDLSYNIQQMLDILIAQKVPVSLCKTCCDGRGIGQEQLIEEAKIATLTELTQWTLDATKVMHI
ncbi:DsrE/DsrF/TusD sulfur relay family protein [uncultured Shewanella sp.]|uniref:DsrE/DsrF/TusD sulfur relay family protein n=1 Tax=Shewanella atlantica TaxID=271099 RepID=UPI00262F1572|nr:DsrE family protein [uncultured Shewanella sp.]